MAIVERSRGIDPPRSEDDDPGGLVPVHRIADLPDAVLVRDDEITALAFRLRIGKTLVVVRVSGPPWVATIQGAFPGLRSRHGHLCAPGAYGGPFHDVVLVDVILGEDGEAEGFQVLDPWFPNNGQPLELALDLFESCYAGPAYACGR
ncbi:MAG: hypothetical protein KF795_22850 [Labilithrix sp.]|nr:hypothetical protein [Labilithrix sp.]